MIDLPKKNNDTDNGENKSDDNSKSMEVSYSNDSNNNQNDRRTNYRESGEDSRERNPNEEANMAGHKEKYASIVSPIFQPQLENQRNQSDLMPMLCPGMKFTGVVDGLVPGGYLISIRGGNGIDLQGKAFFSTRKVTQIESSANVNVNVPWVSPTNVDHTQKNHNQNSNQEKENDSLKNTLNQESCSSFGKNKTPLEFEIDDELYSDYSDFEMPPSPEPHVPDPLLVTNKFVHVVLKQVNPLTGVPVKQTKSLDKGKGILKDCYNPNAKEYKIGIDPFLPRKFPSPAISISPPREGVRKRNFSAQALVDEQYARLSMKGTYSSFLY